MANIKQTLNLIPGVNLSPKSVDSILSVFTTTVNELKIAQEHQAGLAKIAETEAIAATKRATDATTEAGRVASAIKKIESFLA